MKDWQDDFFTTLEATVKEEFDHFFRDVSEWVEDVTEEFACAVESLADEIDSQIPPEIEQLLSGLFEPIIEFYSEDYWDEIENDLTDASEFSLNPKIEPNAEVHPACRGCCHYHGRVYGGNLLVCGMHPYGWEEENCPDWEQ